MPLLKCLPLSLQALSFRFTSRSGHHTFCPLCALKYLESRGRITSHVLSHSWRHEQTRPPLITIPHSNTSHNYWKGKFKHCSIHKLPSLVHILKHLQMYQYLHVRVSFPEKHRSLVHTNKELTSIYGLKITWNEVRQMLGGFISH